MCRKSWAEIAILLIMKEISPQLPVKSAGLSPIVKDRLADTLAKLVPQWQAEPAANWKRVTRPSGIDSYSITIEPYQGWRSLMSFSQKVAGIEIIQSLERLIYEQQRELLGYVITDHSDGSRKIQDCFSLCMILLKEIVRRIGSSSSLEGAIFSVISDIDNLLITETAEYHFFTALKGLKLPDQVDRIDLDGGLYLQALTNEEIAELISYDIDSGHQYDFSPLSVTTALIFKRPGLIKLSVDKKGQALASASHDIYLEQINSVLEALHIFKSGCVARVVSSITVHPTILPNMNGNSSSPLVVNPCFRDIKLNQEDTKNFVKLYKAFVATQRNEVKIAAARLVDAESRTSPVDTLLDAVIGLEALLNNDRAEISFRVALNYAFLCPIVDRRKRFEDIRDVYKTRSSVVHGGLNKDASRLYKHAQLAKECLRDALTRFLTDESLTGHKKLDSDFWLDRVLPLDAASTVAL